MIGYTSDVINGQLVSVAPGQAFTPLTFGAQYTGPSYWPVGSPYNVPPVLPSPTGAMGMTGYNPDMGGYSNQPPTAGAMSASGKMNWFSPKKSPVLWAIGFVVVSLLLLHKVHYRKG